MFYQLQSEFLRSMLTFAIKMQYGMVHNRKKKRKEKKIKVLWILKNLENLWTIPKIITITKRAVILACSGKKENVCVCLLVCDHEWVVDMYVCFMLGSCTGENATLWNWVLKPLAMKYSVK